MTMLQLLPVLLVTSPVLAMDGQVMPASLLNCEQQLLLFGSVVDMKSTDEMKAHGRGRSLENYLDTHVFEFKSPLSDAKYSFSISDLVQGESEKGRAQLKKVIGPLLLAMTIIASIVIPALMTVIKLIAVKGLWSGVVSLIITKLLGLKELLHHHHSHGSHHDDSRKPYFIYLPHGKHRREEDGINIQNQQPPWEHWNQGNWDNKQQI